MTDKQITETLDFLKMTALLRDVELSELRAAAEQCACRKIRQGEILFRNGDASSFIFFLKTGLITESINYRESVDVIIKIKFPGDYFGETAVMAGIPFLSTTLAVADSELVAMPKDVFLALAKQNFSVCRHVIVTLTDRLTRSAQKMVNNMYLDAEGRLASTMLGMISTQGTSSPYELPITQEKLAASCGLVRQTVAEILGNWKKDGWLTTGRGKVTIADTAPLLRIVANSEMHC